MLELLDYIAAAINEKIREELACKDRVIVAIDGRSASGKSTLGRYLRDKWAYNLVSMDDFFLRREQRTQERLAEIGGNIDYERFIAEVLNPLASGREFAYRAYDCQSMDFGEERRLAPGRVTIVEGSYSLHPKFASYYDIKIFLSLDSEGQLKRLRLRNPEKLQDFIERWIPKEEDYFRHFAIEEEANLVFRVDR